MGKSPPCRTLPSKASLRDVSPRLALPLAEAAVWVAFLQRKLNTARLLLAAKQFISLADRSPSVQAALLNRGSVVKGWFGECGAGIDRFARVLRAFFNATGGV